jgi:(2R)-ethylmalonyl-CoA mutase
LANLEAMGGAIGGIDYMKAQLVTANAARVSGIETGDTTVIGVNKFTQGEPSPLVDADGGIMTVDPAVEDDQNQRLAAWRAERDADAVAAALSELRRVAGTRENIMPASIAAARVGVTTGEWAGVMRAVHGQYRGPTGVSQSPSNQTEGLDPLRDAVDQVSTRLGRKLKFLMAKPGLDGHSNGAEQIAYRARDCGMEISYAGIRLTPAEIVDAAKTDDPHVIGVSILSGSHLQLVEDLMAQLAAHDLSHIPIIVGGIIPDQDADTLRAMGVSRVYTPKDFELNRIVMDVVELAAPSEIAAQ